MSPMSQAETSFSLYALFYIATIISAAFMIWMLVDAAKGDKFWWLVFIIGLPLLGSVVYYFVEKRHDYAKLG